MPAWRLNSNTPCGDESTHSWGCSNKTLFRARVRIEVTAPHSHCPHGPHTDSVCVCFQPNSVEGASWGDTQIPG